MGGGQRQKVGGAKTKEEEGEVVVVEGDQQLACLGVLNMGEEAEKLGEEGSCWTMTPWIPEHDGRSASQRRSRGEVEVGKREVEEKPW